MPNLLPFLPTLGEGQPMTGYTSPENWRGGSAWPRRC